MVESILYLGDTALADAAAYLAGVMTDAGWSFDYLPSDQAVTTEMLQQPRRLYVISDYPAAMFDVALQERIAGHVAGGAGLLMIGGWESFHGQDGFWNGTPVGGILPVEIAGEDDRVNCDQPVLVRRCRSHPIVDGLPWEQRPPVIGGYNRVVAKPTGQVVLQAERFAASVYDGKFQFVHRAGDPLLVVGNHGSGSVVALATDVAPHWVGPLVDWGDRRVTAQAAGANEIEVGNLYAQFLRQLLSWTRSGDAA